MRKFLLFSSALIVSVSMARADDAPVVIADYKRTPLETIVVTATRTPQPIDKTGASIDVITADDLQRQQIVTMTDAVAEIPGVSVAQNGGVGQTTTVFLRGAASGQSLFLIDGIRIEDPSSTDEGAVLQDILINNIDRIEVLRGPQSTLYGSDTIGGVVNIITKRGGSSPFALNASGEGGSFDTWHLNAAATGSEGRVEYGAALNWFDTGGTSAADPRAGNTEKDGYRNFGATLNTRIHLTDNVSFDARGYYTESHVDFDGFPPPLYSFADTPEYGTNHLMAGYFGLNVDLFDNVFHNRLAFTGLGSDRKTYGNFDFLGNYTPDINFYGKGGSARFEYQGIVDVNDDNQVTFGAETQHTTLATHSVFDLTPQNGGTRTTEGYYGQWQTTVLDALTLTGGVRYDHDSEFGSHTSVKLNGAYKIDSTGTLLHAAFGDGFKAPSLYELYSDYSNPTTALKPEVAQGWEVGVAQEWMDGDFVASLTYFNSHTTNLIDFFSCFGVVSPECTLRALAGGYYVNINKSRANGFEGEVTAKLSDAFSAKANFTALAAKNITYGAPLGRRPRFSANVELDWTPTDAITVGGTLDFVGPRYNDNFAFTPLQNATTVDIFGSYQIDETWQVYGRVNNLFDERAEPIAGYGRPGRAFTAGIRTAL